MWGTNPDPTRPYCKGVIPITRTRRIYNNPRLKKTKRINLLPVQIPLQSMTVEEQKAFVRDSLRNSISISGFFYHPYASGLCMGNCHYCRDHGLDQKHLRKSKKAEFRKVIESELSTDDIDYDQD